MEDKKVHFDLTDLKKILSLKDEEGKTPNIYLWCSGRIGGKTTTVYNFLLEDALENDHKFVIITRQKNLLNGAANDFIVGYKYKEYDEPFSVSNVADGQVKQILYGDKIIGSVISLSASDNIKRMSKLLEDKLEWVFFDEVIVEEGSSYISGEMTKLQSILQSIFRMKHYNVIMATNLVSSICPAFSTFVNSKGMCITEMLEMNVEAKTLKGIGWVLKIDTISDDIVNTISENNRAFAASRYTRMSKANQFMDDKTLIDKKIKKEKRTDVCYLLKGNDKYLLSKTIKNGYFYLEKVKECTNYKIVSYTLTQNNMNTETLYISGNSLIRNQLRILYDNSYIFFDSLGSKQLILDFIKYTELE